MLTLWQWNTGIFLFQLVVAVYVFYIDDPVFGGDYIFAALGAGFVAGLVAFVISIHISYILFDVALALSSSAFAVAFYALESVFILCVVLSIVFSMDASRRAWKTKRSEDGYLEFFAISLPLGIGFALGAVLLFFQPLIAQKFIVRKKIAS